MHLEKPFWASSHWTLLGPLARLRQMKFEFLTPELFQKWDDLCEKSDDAWFWHTSAWLQYSLAYRPDLSSTDKSFMIFDQDNQPLGICPLFLERAQFEGQEIYEFAFGGWPLPPPAFINGLSTKRKEELSKATYQHIDMLAAEHGVSRSLIRISPLTPNSFNSLMKYGYLDISLNTQLIDCSAPLETIKKGLRKGHISDLKRALKASKITVVDKTNITEEIFRNYEELHIKASGRRTRPQSTFDMMLAMIRRGNAILVTAQHNNAYVGHSMVIVYKTRAYYASAATDPDYDSFPLSHAMQWLAIEWLHERGYDLYEIGLQRYGNQIHDTPTAKELQIAHFKRGFGGQTVPLFTGEKFFNSKHCEARLKSRLKAFLETQS